MPRAIWLTKDNMPELRTIEQNYHPGETEVLVKVEYSGINPADISHGTLAQGLQDYPCGYDFAGTVLEVGAKRSPTFKPGDKVTGLGAPEKNKPIQYGTHQDFHVARYSILKIGDLPMHELATLPVVTYTAADALLNQLELPWEGPGPFEGQTPILIWGGSSTVGCAAIQLAKHMQLSPIITTASPKHHPTLKKLGADICFDYNSPDVPGQINAYLKSVQAPALKHVFDCVAKKKEPSSTSLCEASCADGVAGALLTSAIPAAATPNRSQWKRTFACRGVDLDMGSRDGVALIHEARPDWQSKMEVAVEWAVANYGQGYCMPNVVVVKGGEKGVQAIQDVWEGKASLQKFVIEHPI